MIELIKTTDFESLLMVEQLVVVDFFASWCPPCKMLLPVVDEFSEKHPEIQVIKVNVDTFNSLANKYNVHEVPTLMFFRNQEVIYQHKGFVDLEAIEEMCNNL